MARALESSNARAATDGSDAHTAAELFAVTLASESATSARQLSLAVLRVHHPRLEVHLTYIVTIPIQFSVYGMINMPTERTKCVNGGHLDALLPLPVHKRRYIVLYPR